MKLLGRQWGKIKVLGESLFQKAEAEARTAGRAFQSEASTSGSVAEYAKLNFPKGRWEGRGQRRASERKPASSPPSPGQNWVGL